jgi:hypothetical protein
VNGELPFEKLRVNSLWVAGYGLPFDYFGLAPSFAQGYGGQDAAARAPGWSGQISGLIINPRNLVLGSFSGLFLPFYVMRAIVMFYCGRY